MPTPPSLPVVEPWAQRLKALLEHRPLFLGVETTNICNARCVFCAYRKMQRPKQVMPPELFTKTIDDYVDMGGGAVKLTPIVGDVLLDPHFLDRLRYLRSRPEIGLVYVVTNAIAWDRYSPDERRFILDSVDWLGISTGGLDADAYRRMYAVDRWDKVRRAIHEICDLKGRHNLPLELHLSFRALRPLDELLGDPSMTEFLRPEIDRINGGNEYLNWGGLIGEEDLPPGARLIPTEQSPQRVRETRRNPCWVFHLGPEILSSGLVSACVCQNPEGADLIIGDISEQHLGDIWTGQTFQKFKAAFGTDELADICKRCTLYRDGESFLRHPALANFRIGNHPALVIQKHRPDGDALALSRALMRLRREGYGRLALYGAGRFTRRALSARQYGFQEHPIVAILDDDPALAGSRIAHLPVIRPREALARGVDAVVLSTDCHGGLLWEASAFLRDAGVHVILAGPFHRRDPEGTDSDVIVPAHVLSERADALPSQPCR